MMKKNLLTKLVIAVVLIISIAFSAMPSEGVSAAAISNSKVHKKLQKKIKNKLCKYAFADLDKDGTDELIAMLVSGKFDKNGVDTEKDIVVFRYSDGKITEMLRRSLDTTGMYDKVEFKVYYSDACYLEIIESDYDITQDTVYKLSDGAFSQICKMKSEIFEMLSETKYYIGGKKASKKRYEDFTKPLLKNIVQIKVEQSGTGVFKKYVKAKLKAALAFNLENDWKGLDVKTSYSDVYFDDGIDELVVTIDSDRKYVMYITPDSDSLSVNCETLSTKTVPEDVKEYVSKHYSKLLNLADEGYFSLSAEYKKKGEKDYIRFGNWNMGWYDDDIGEYVTEPEKTGIEWEVLSYSEDGKSALVISKYVLEDRKYNQKFKNVSWETCTLRKWLNEDFYNTAFTEKEKSLIKPVAHENVEDRVFLLSDDEVEEYLIEDTQRGAKVNRKGYYKTGNNASWWLRSQGYSYNGGDEDYSPLYLNGKYAFSVDFSGEYDSWGESSRVDEEFGVRPVVWIELTPEIIKENNLTPGSMEVISRILVGFGSYDMKKESFESGYNTEDMEWQILDYDEKNNRVMLPSKYLVEEGEYHKKNKKVTWEKSTLREWLNGYFYYDAFSAPERTLIRLTDVKNNKNPKYGTDCGKDTKDYLFLLSLDEVEKYFSVDLSSDEYMYIPGLKIRYYNGEEGYWWLRSMGSGYDNKDYLASFVYFDSNSCFVNSEGRCVNSPIGICPVMYIDLK